MPEQIPTTGIDNNDYVFLVQTDAAGNTVYKRFKYAADQANPGWVWEYDLNNSSFTAAQWAAIQSGITALLVQKLKALPDAATYENDLAGKQDTLPVEEGTGTNSMRTNSSNTASGEYSVAIGENNAATAKGAVAVGKNNGARQEYAYCFGENNYTIGWDSFLVGTSNGVYRHMGMAIGRQNTSYAWAGICLGLGNKTQDGNDGEVALGRWNETKPGLVFSVGCGTSDSNRKNALEIYDDGTVIFPQAAAEEDEYLTLNIN